MTIESLQQSFYSKTYAKVARSILPSYGAGELQSRLFSHKEHQGHQETVLENPNFLQGIQLSVLRALGGFITLQFSCQTKQDPLFDLSPTVYFYP